MDGMPVEDVGRKILGLGDSADGIRDDREVSIWIRIALADNIDSPYLRFLTPETQLLIASHVVHSPVST